MDIHKKFSCIQEYTEFITELFSWVDNYDKSLWKEDDLPKLKPWFEYSNTKQGVWTNDIQNSFEYYKECLELYGHKNVDMRNSLSQIRIEQLMDCFYFRYVDEEDIDNIDVVLDNFPYSFPVIVTGIIESGYDRFGDISLLCIRFVSLSEFTVNTP